MGRQVGERRSLRREAAKMETGRAARSEVLNEKRRADPSCALSKQVGERRFLRREAAKMETGRAARWDVLN